MTLTAALKEWAIAVEALTQGDTILLLRKGGIREAGGRFSVPQSQVWLYPTYEHQKPQLLKPEYGDRVSEVPSGWHPERVVIRSWAEVTHTLQVQEPEVVERLLPFHVWNDQFVTERLNWKPRTPLYVLLLRVYRLAAALEIPYRESYGGCRSWIELEVPLEQEGAAALSDQAYEAQVQRILAEIG